MVLMQQQLNVLIQENNPKIGNLENNMIIPLLATQSTLGENKKARRDKKGESSINLSALEDT